MARRITAAPRGGVTRRLAAILVLALGCALGPAAPTFAQGPRDKPRPPYAFGVFPYFGANRMADIWEPVARHLELALGRPIRFQTTSSFERYSERLAAQVYDLALVNPFEYLRAVDKLGYIPLARPRDSLITWFLARPDSTLTGIGDLRGRTVAMPPASSVNAQIGLYALRRAGLFPDKDVTILHFETHQTCVHQMMISTAAVCVMGQAARRLAERDYGVTLRVVDKGVTLPPPVFVVHPRVPAADRSATVRALTGLSESPEGREIVDRTGFTGFISTDGKEYEEVRTARRLLEAR